MITVEEVKRIIAEIEATSDDNEVAHQSEDALYLTVLEAIANGATNGKELAIEALKANKLAFRRWYA